MTARSGMRVPPGRAGRLWLERRLATAEHAAELLEQKLRVLNREESRLAQAAVEAEGEWQRRCSESETATLRAAMLSGRRGLRMATGHPVAVAEIEIGSTMGLEHPVGGSVRLNRDSEHLVVGSAAVTTAAEAASAALEAALAAAVARAALRAVQAEVAGTRRILRGVQRRWLPRLSSALAEVRLELEEQERAAAVLHTVGRRAHLRTYRRPHSLTETGTSP